jgi:uncharacterized protein (TIGR02270 family)
LSALAIKASLALRSSKGWRRCLELAHEPAGDPYPSLLLVALLGQPADHDVLFMQLKNPARVERTLWVLGFCGTLHAANACLDHLGSEDARVAKAAAEAVAWIGGLDLKDRRFRASAAEPAPDETLPPLDEDDLDADLGLDGVDDLPVPNPAEIARWWKERRGTITANQRYLLGRPSSVGAIVHALDSGSLWRRHAVAVELAIRSGGEQHVSTDAFSSRQRRQIAALVGMSAGQWSQVGV